VLRGAIIGFGAVAANGHRPAYAQSRDAKIVAVVDRTADTAYLVCSECEHTWRIASSRPKQRTRA